jgi:hypothetical protein
LPFWQTASGPRSQDGSDGAGDCQSFGFKAGEKYVMFVRQRTVIVDEEVNVDRDKILLLTGFLYLCGE